MFKFIFVTLLLLVAAATAADDTAEIVEMAFEALDTMDSVDNALGEDDTSENMGYVYNDGALEDNINIAVNAAILDKYGQSVTSQISQQQQVENTRQLYNADIVNKHEEAVANDVPQQAEDTKQVNTVAVKTTKSPKAAAKVISKPTTAAATYDKIVEKPVKAAPKVLKVLTSDSTGNTDTLTHFENRVHADGSYAFDFAQSSGLQFQEMGQGGQYARGSYQYISPEGQHISVTYTADENGFHPESDVLPTPPPVPAYIQKALDYIRDHPSAEELAKREARAKQV